MYIIIFSVCLFFFNPNATLFLSFTFSTTIRLDNINMNGIFVTNILNFNSRDQNELVRFALFDLVNTRCRDLGQYQLQVKAAPHTCATTIAFLHFNNWHVNAEAVSRLDGGNLRIDLSTRTARIHACINTVPPAQHVVDRYHRA